MTEVTSRSVTVSWYPAYDTGNTPILGYLLQYRARLTSATTSAWQMNNMKKNLTIPATASSATIIGLEPDTEYQVRVEHSESEIEIVLRHKGHKDTAQGTQIISYLSLFLFGTERIYDGAPLCHKDTAKGKKYT